MITLFETLITPVSIHHKRSQHKMMIKTVQKKNQFIT